MTERYYEDGTEPTISPHLDRACRGVSCQQGRQPCAHPDLCEDERSSSLERVLVGLVLMVSVAAVVGFVAGVLT